MPSYTRVFSTLYVSALIALAGFTPSQPTFAVATPFPLPMIKVNNAHTSPLKYEAGPRPQDIKSNNSTSGQSSHGSRAVSLSSGAGMHERDLLSDLVNSGKSAQTHASDLKQCADSCAKSSDQCTSSLSLFTSDLRLFYGYASDKGLAYYDRNSELETSLKDLVNSFKDVLGFLNCIVSNEPLLGPIVGPLVYEIKCIVEELLDLIEDWTDATINSSLQELLDSFDQLCLAL